MVDKCGEFFSGGRECRVHIFVSELFSMQGNNSPTGRTCSGNWDWKKKKEDQRRFGLAASIGYIKIVMLYISFLLGMV